MIKSLVEIDFNQNHKDESEMYNNETEFQTMTDIGEISPDLL